MIHGIVNADLEATIRLHVAGPNSQQQEITAIIDTGYNGALSLPSEQLAQLSGGVFHIARAVSVSA